MKLTYEDKVQIYELRKHGQTFNQLSKRFGVDASGLRYMTRLIERYGIEIIKKGKNRYYSPELKQEMIDKVLLEDCSQQSVCLDYGLSNQGLLNNWIAQYKNGYTIVEKTRGRPPKMGRKRKYSSYQGEVGKKADNLFNVNLKALNQWKSVIRM